MKDLCLPSLLVRSSAPSIDYYICITFEMDFVEYSQGKSQPIQYEWKNSLLCPSYYFNFDTFLRCADKLNKAAVLVACNAF